MTEVASTPAKGHASGAAVARPDAAPGVSTSDAAPGVRAPAEGRAPELVMARRHLRLGSTALARAELEALSAADLLDTDGLVDLAEARWRTGSLLAAGEPARRAIEATPPDAEGSPPVVALVIAAEAASVLGRPTEARRLAERARAAADAPIDAIFAGMPRSTVWPPDPSEPRPAPATLFGTDEPAYGSALSTGVSGPGATASDRAAADLDEAVSLAAAPDGPGLWDLADPVADMSAAADASAVAPAPGDVARGDLAPGPDGAADLSSATPLDLTLALRLDPSSADAVLAAIDPSTSDVDLLVVRGDALRLVGRESEALDTYRSARAARRDG